MYLSAFPIYALTKADSSRAKSCIREFGNILGMSNTGLYIIEKAKNRLVDILITKARCRMSSGTC